MSERQPEIDLGRKKIEPSETSDGILHQLVHSVSAKKIDEQEGKYNRPKKVGFGTSLLDKGPTLSDLIEEEHVEAMGENKKRVGFLDVLESPKRDIRVWISAFWREPAVMFLFDHQNNFLVDEEMWKLGSEDMDITEMLRTVNGKFKEILQKMGVSDVADPFDLFANDDGWSVRIRINAGEFEKMKAAVMISTDFTEQEKKEVTDLIGSYIKNS